MSDVQTSSGHIVGAEPFKVRASSWGELFDCAYRWEAKHILGIQRATGGAAALGTALHKGTAVFDQARIDGKDISADDAAGVFVDTLKDPGYEVAWNDEDLKQKDAEKVGIQLTTMYCTEFSPHQVFRAVELVTKPLEVDCGNGVSILLTGQLDRSRLREVGGSLGITDLKSGAQAVQKGVAKIKGHRPQVGAYELLYEHTTGELINAPAEIIGLKTSGTLQIATNEIHDAKGLMVGKPGLMGLIEHAAAMFRTGLFPPNPSSNLCGEKYCVRWDTCPYHD